MKIVYILVIMITIINADFFDSASSMFHKLRDKVITKDETKSNQQLREERFKDIWKDIKDKLVKGYKLYDKKEKAPDNTFFIGKDKGDYQEDIDEVLNEIIDALVDDNLLKYKDDIADIDNKIKKYEEKLARLREDRISAPKESTIHTTKAKYDKKIKETLEEIEILKSKKHIVYQKLKDDFKRVGVKLDTKQIDIILDRVDGDDIIQLSLVMDVLKQITAQILELMKESGEDLTQAKRYYGMHLVSLALVVHIQQKYIQKVNKVYIPKIDKLIQQSKDIIYKTEIAIDKENSPTRREVYESNLKAQKLTLKVAKLYKGHLISAINSVKKAQITAKKNLDLAENTYATVSLSSGLYNLIKENEAMFDKISQIQMPKIEPFENLQIQKKYKELTKKILEE
jgi:hypothetical protein